MSLRALLDAHKIAYAEFGKALYELGGGSGDPARASRQEQRALSPSAAILPSGEGIA